MPVARDALGVQPLYYRTDGSGWGRSIDALRRRSPALPLRPDREGIEGYLRGEPDDHRTCVRGVALCPAGHRLRHGPTGWCPEPAPALPSPHGTLEQALVDAVATVLDASGPAALALSGGLDSALVLALVRRALGRTIPVYTLAFDLPGYGELEATRRIARHLGVTLHELPANAEDLRAALPETVAAVEVPLYNPHPASKLLLARALAREGIEVVLTGDAADQLFAGEPQGDYLPLLDPLFGRAGVQPCSPFFDPRVLAHAAKLPPDPDKGELRRLAARWLPAAVFEAPKNAQLAPDLQVEQLVGVDAMHRRAAQLGLPPPRLDQARSRCGYATLCMLWRWLERPC